jgi:hypothetical protein
VTRPLCCRTDGLANKQLSLRSDDAKRRLQFIRSLSSNKRPPSTRQTADSDTPPHPTVHGFIDSRASLQFARRPSFVSGKRGVTFFRAMFVDRSGVQIAVRPAGPTLATPQPLTLEIEASVRRGNTNTAGQGHLSSQKFYSTKKHDGPTDL